MIQKINIQRYVMLKLAYDTIVARDNGFSYKKPRLSCVVAYPE